MMREGRLVWHHSLTPHPTRGLAHNGNWYACSLADETVRYVARRTTRHPAAGNRGWEVEVQQGQRPGERWDREYLGWAPRLTEVKHLADVHHHRTIKTMGSEDLQDHITRFPL